jgi:hypothetical protein
MLPTNSITMLDIAFIFLSVVVLCEVLRIVIVGIRNLQIDRNAVTLHQQNGPGENLTKPDGG